MIEISGVQTIGDIDVEFNQYKECFILSGMVVPERRIVYTAPPTTIQFENFCDEGVWDENR